MRSSEFGAVSRDVLTESCRGLTADQQKIVQGIYRELRPLLEVQLTADQINQLFGNVQQNAGRTMIGKGVDVAVTVDQAINRMGRWLQDTRPVQAFDQKFDQLKTSIAQKFPELDRNLTALGTWAKDNPGKTAAIVGVLTTIAALGAGPAGGAIAGQILRGATELLKGEKLSTAVGRGAKTAAYGALAGFGIDKIGDLLGNGVRMVADNLFPGAQRLNLSYMAQGTGPETFQNLRDVVGSPRDLAPIQSAWNQAAKAWSDGQYSQANALFQQAKDAAAKLADPAYVAQLSQDQNTRQAIIAGAKSVMMASDALAATAQGAAAGAGAGGGKQTAPVKESKRTSRPLNEQQIQRLFAAIANEGVFDNIKAGASNLAARAGQKISQVGQSLTNRVTADSLRRAWVKAGSPTDSDAVAAVLSQAGVDNDVITKSFTAMQIPVPAQAKTAEPADSDGSSVSQTGATAPQSPNATAASASTAATASTVPTSQDRQMVGINPKTGRPFLSPATDVPGTTVTPQAQPVTAPQTEPVAAQAQPVATPQVAPAADTEPSTTGGAKRRIGAPAGKQAIDQALQTVDKVRSDRRQGVIDYGQAELDAAERRLAQIRRRAPVAAEPAAAPDTGTFQPTTPAPSWAQGQPIKIGRQTIKPSDPNYAKITKAMPVAENIKWTADWDPSLRLLDRMKKQP